MIQQTESAELLNVDTVGEQVGQPFLGLLMLDEREDQRIRRHVTGQVVVEMQLLAGQRVDRSETGVCERLVQQAGRQIAELLFVHVDLLVLRNVVDVLVQILQHIAGDQENGNRMRVERPQLPNDLDVQRQHGPHDDEGDHLVLQTVRGLREFQRGKIRKKIRRLESNL